MVTGLLELPSALFRPKIALRVFRQMLVRNRKSAVPLIPGRELPEAVPVGDAG